MDLPECRPPPRPPSRFVRDVLGHADLAPRPIYLRTEQKTIVRELAKLKGISRAAHFSER
jgi:hypothetical protein